MTTSEVTHFLANLDDALEPSLALTLAGLAVTVSVFLTGALATLANDIQKTKEKGGQPSEWQLNRMRSIKASIRYLFISFYVLLLSSLEGLSFDQLVGVDNMPNLLKVELVLSSLLTGVGLLFFWLGAKEVASLMRD